MPTTPANYFHLLRRQAKSPTRRPLVVMTPKSMLRLKSATSAAEEFTDGAFQCVIADPVPAKPVRRVLLCSGKVYYDLAARRTDDVAIVRVEQLYPLPAEEIRTALAAYGDVEDVVWVQEEPANNGAWPYFALHLPAVLGDGQTLRRVSRRESASPATGSAKVHELEQQALLDAAYA